jgi:transcription antitermination factor NusB
MGRRRRSRELAVQVLFHLEFGSDDPGEAFDIICDSFESPASIRSFSRDLVLGVCEEKEHLDSLIASASKHWRLDRMPFLDKCILRMAVFEILLMEDIPPKVSIDEAVEIGKRFGGNDSSGFINGVLDNIYSSLVREGRLKKNEK